MSAIVLDDEEADQQPGRRDRQQQRDPIVAVDRRHHGRQQRDERHRRRHDLDDRAPGIGAAILRAVGCEPPRLGFESGHVLGVSPIGRWSL